MKLFEGNQSKVFVGLIRLARKNGVQVKFCSLLYNYGRSYGNRIAIANDIDIQGINNTLAHELAHTYLHYDKGDILKCNGDYEEQADRAARMLLDALTVIK